MKEHGILFSAPMVREILDGRKTQTRRIIKPQPEINGSPHILSAKPGHLYLCPDLIPTSDDRGWVFAYCESVGLTHHMGVQSFVENHCPYGVVGDRLWVRESFFVDHVDCLKGPLPKVPPNDFKDMLYYLADADPNSKLSPCCQLISECCCYEIGKPRWRVGRFMPRWASRITLEITDVRVQRLQDIGEADALNGDSHPWASNPWVWAITFKRVEAA